MGGQQKNKGKTMETITRTQIEQQQREKEAAINRGQQLFAEIKKSSKYFHQNDCAKNEPARWGGFPFKVFIDPRCGDYCVQGGPGGQYRLDDVNIFVVEGGRELRVA